MKMCDLVGKQTSTTIWCKKPLTTFISHEMLHLRSNIRSFDQIFEKYFKHCNQFLFYFFLEVTLYINQITVPK